MNQKFCETYEKINEKILINLIHNKNDEIDKSLLDVINSKKNIYDYNKKKDIIDYQNNPSISKFEYILKKYKENYILTQLDEENINLIRNYIIKNVKFHIINKNEICNLNIFNEISKNFLYKKYNNQIFFHFDCNIRGYRTLYLPLKNECHIIGKYKNTKKDFSFISHELGHCFQLLSTNEFILDYTIAEIYACSNEILMSKNTPNSEFVIKFINNKIIESMCMFDFYKFLYQEDNFTQENLDYHWKKICKKYNCPYKQGKYLNDINCLEKPQNILSYTISYLISLKFSSKNYNDFLNICKKNINLANLLNLLN